MEVTTGLQDVDDGVQVDESPSKETKMSYPPSMFTDEKGNLKFVNFIVRFPKTIFGIIFLICFLLSYLLNKTVFNAGNPFTDPTMPAYDVMDIRSLAFDSYRLAAENVKENREELKERLRRKLQTESNNTSDLVNYQEDFEDVTYWVFESETPDGLFATKESISKMYEALSIFTDDEDYQYFCMREYKSDNTSKCALPLSPLNMYYASSWDYDAVQNVIDQLLLYNDDNSTILNGKNIFVYNTLAVCIEFELFCDTIPEFFYTPENEAWAMALNDNITKIFSTWDGKGELIEDFEQATLFSACLNELITKKRLMNFGFDENFSFDNMKSMYSRSLILWGSPLDRSKLSIIANITVEDDKEIEDRDILKEWVVTHFLDQMEEISSVDYNEDVNSFYFMGIVILDVLLQIVKRDASLSLISLSFVFIYIRIMVGSWFLALVGLAEIFFSIPISWLIFNSLGIKYFSFLNTLCIFIVAAIGADDIFIFMDAYKQSAYQDASVLESLESRMSWVYRRTGSAMAITSATTCAAFLCTLLTPLASVQSFGIFAALVIFIDYVLVMSLFCTAVVIFHENFEREGYCCCEPICCYKKTEQNPTQKALANAMADNTENVSGEKISIFFRTKVATFIKSGKNRVFISLIFVTWIIIACIFGSRIEPTQETEQFLDPNHPLQRATTILGQEFPNTQDDTGSMIYFAWGLGVVDRDGVNRLLDPDFIGNAVFSETFDFNEQCQTEMLNICEDLKTNVEYAPFIKQDSGLGVVHCFVEELAAFNVYGNLDDCESVRRGLWKNETWQISSDEIDSVMENFVKQTSCYSNINETMLTFYGDNIGWDGSSLKYVSMSTESAVLIPWATKTASATRNEYDEFIKIGNELDETMESYCASKVTVTDLDNHFVFMNTQEIYVRTAIQSSVLGLAIAFSVLMIATRVFHIALFATISILCVLVSVLGTVVMLGWTLGSIESVLISIIAGFAVDYVVHLAHAYERVDGDTATRITAAFGEMGISVLSGMVTSVGASIPLFLCQLQFFKKFGTFICLTIAFSWIFANFFFMSVVAQAKIPIDNNKKGCKI